MEVLNKIQNLLSKNLKKEVASNRKADQAPKTNGSKSANKPIGKQSLKDRYGTTHLFI